MKEKKVNEVKKDIVTNNNDVLFHFSATIMTSCSKAMERCIRLDNALDCFSLSAILNTITLRYAQGQYF